MAISGETYYPVSLDLLARPDVAVLAPIDRLVLYELAVMGASQYRHGSTLTLDLALAFGSMRWGLSRDDAAACVRRLADAGLLDSGGLEGGFVVVPEVLEWQQYCSERKAAGKQGGRPSKQAKRTTKNVRENVRENVGENVG